MNSSRQTRISGIVGMGCAILWLIALFAEYRYGLEPPGNGSSLYYADQFLFLLALAGYLFMLLGLWRSHAAGQGAFGRLSLGIFIAGLASLLIAQLVDWVIKDPNFILFPIGGILQLLGGLLTGIAVVTAQRWRGWQRFAPLLQGVYYLIVLFLPIMISDQSPSQLTESIWQGTWFLTSLALFSESGNP